MAATGLDVFDETLQTTNIRLVPDREGARRASRGHQAHAAARKLFGGHAQPSAGCARD
jgi:hypothetical protein